MKEKIGELINAINIKETNAEEAKFYNNFVCEALNKFTKYFNSVYTDVMSSEISIRLRDSGRISQEDFEFRRIRTDKDRRIAHDAAIDACNQLNRLCKRYDVLPFCPDNAERYVVADFIGKFVYNIYQEGIGPQSLDQSIELARIKSKNPDKAYDDITPQKAFANKEGER